MVYTGDREIRDDEASIVRDTIDYIRALQDQEKRLEAEIAELELKMSKKKNVLGMDQIETPSIASTSKAKRTNHSYDDLSRSRSSPIEVYQLKVSYVEERMVLVTLECGNCGEDIMVKLFTIYRSLKLKIVNNNMAFDSGRLLNTMFIEANEEETDLLKKQIETAIAALKWPSSPMST